MGPRQTKPQTTPEKHGCLYQNENEYNLLVAQAEWHFTYPNTKPPIPRNDPWWQAMVNNKAKTGFYIARA